MRAGAAASSLALAVTAAAASSPGTPSPAPPPGSSAAAACDPPGAPPDPARRAGGPRALLSTAPTTWIWASPAIGAEPQRLGYVRAGTSLATTSPDRTPGPGCPGGFLPVEPAGWVCVDRTVTLDPESRLSRAVALVEPGPGTLPYGYALSDGAPMYTRLPAVDEWTRAERWFGPAGVPRPLAWGSQGHGRLADARAIEPTGEAPFFLDAGGALRTETPLGLVRRRLPPGSMVAYTAAFRHAGRTFLLSADGTVVPADRVRPFRPSAFRGVELSAVSGLPVGFARAGGASRWSSDGAGALRLVGALAARAPIELDAAHPPRSQDGARYLAVRGSGGSEWIRESELAVARGVERLPIGVAPGERWLEVSIGRGTLVAYEGLRPVFATLHSPGAGGVPRRGVDPVKASTTPLGVFRVTFKHRAATMSPETGEDRKFWIADVPWTQYFAAPFALHTAYWHEDFGQPMSAGCVNVSPEDGKRLFEWTEPRVPPGWGGAAALGRGTKIAIVR
ncbi:MAG: L,D-transpeptidase [Polyangiaceae bacterium]|nr:L,D-transpeptidase [Polyangiaceae bacterium]